MAVAAFIAIFSLSWWWIGARKYDFHILSIFLTPSLRRTKLTKNLYPFRKYTGPRTKDLLDIIPSEDLESHTY